MVDTRAFFCLPSLNIVVPVPISDPVSVPHPVLVYAAAFVSIPASVLVSISLAFSRLRLHSYSRPVPVHVPDRILRPLSRLRLRPRSRSLNAPFPVPAFVPRPIPPPVPVPVPAPDSVAVTVHSFSYLGPRYPLRTNPLAHSSGLRNEAITCTQAPLTVCKEDDACGMKELCVKQKRISAEDVIQLFAPLGAGIRPSESPIFALPVPIRAPR